MNFVLKMLISMQISRHLEPLWDVCLSCSDSTAQTVTAWAAKEYCELQYKCQLFLNFRLKMER